jgi:hypothetical protein
MRLDDEGGVTVVEIDPVFALVIVIFCFVLGLAVGLELAGWR